MTSGFNRIAILGLGLIGSSLARALSGRGLATHISAYNRSETALQLGLKEGFIHSGHTHAADAVADADLVILATHPGSFADMMQAIAPSLKKECIVTDVGSVKQSAIAAVTPYLPDHVSYVPSHPIAGSEKTGAEAGRADLFAGRQVILTPEESKLRSMAVERVSELWQKIGAKVEFMPAFLHDLVYAYVSHLPHIAAFAVAPLTDAKLQDEGYQRFIRLRKSDPQLWADICLANAEQLFHAMDDFIRFLTQIHGELKETVQDNQDKKINVSLLFAKLISSCLIASASLLEEQAGVNPTRYAGPGFADMTNLASGDPQELLAAVSDNHSKILPLLENTLNRLQQMRNAISAGHRQELAGLFST